MTTPTFSSPRAAVLGALRDYAGGSAQAMTAAFVGFGAIVNDVGLTLWQGLASSGLMALVPAQMAMADLYRTGAGLAAILLAVAFISARLLPMSMSLMPLLREGARRPALLYLAAFPLASTAWAYGTRRCPDLPPDLRLPYYLTFAFANIAVIVLATWLGFALADRLPGSLTSALVFVTPVFFLLLFTAEAPNRACLYALALGVVAGPLLYEITPEWSVLLSGLAAGTLGFLLDQIGRRTRD